MVGEQGGRKSWKTKKNVQELTDMRENPRKNGLFRKVIILLALFATMSEP